MNDLKLFVWEDVLTDYTPGIMFALAPDVETARALVRASGTTIIDEELEQEPQVFDTPMGYAMWGGG